MYFDYYELERHPFRITPETNSFYSGADRGATLRALTYSIRHGDAIVKLVGEVGSGKTMICRMLESALPDNIDIVYLGNPRLTPDNILQAIAFELDLPISRHESASRIMMLKSLQEHLLEKHMQGRQVVVFVEEAQCMPLETLEEIRLLSNLETQQSKLLQVVLFGQPELDHNLSLNHVRQIRDRIANSFYLPSLSEQDVADYVQFRLFSAGYKGQALFSKSAIKYIHKKSHGLMRRINILADKALLAAYATGSQIVTHRHVASALSDSDFDNSHTKGHRAAIALSALAAAFLAISISLFLFAEKPVLTSPTIKATAGNKLVKKQPVNQNTRKVKPVSSSQVQHLLDARFDATKKWIKSVNLNHFTIQVLLIDANKSRELESFFSQDGIDEVLHNLYMVLVTAGGKQKIAVLYSSFGDFHNAQRVIKNLPRPLLQQEAHIRYLKTLLTESFSTAELNR